MCRAIQIMQEGKRKAEAEIKLYLKNATSAGA